METSVRRYSFDMSTAAHLISFEESLTMPESNLEEVVDGQLLTMPPASKKNNGVIRELEWQLDRIMSPDLYLTHGTGFLLKRSSPLSHPRSCDSKPVGMEKRPPNHL